MAMTTKRATSRKIDGVGLRHDPSGAPWKSVALSPESTNTSSTKPSTVDTMRTGVASADTSVALISSSSSAASGRM